MSIEYENEFTTMDMTCDDCDEIGIEEGSFMDCIELFKDDGWRISGDGKGDYTHTCPDCIEKEKTIEHDKL